MRGAVATAMPARQSEYRRARAAALMRFLFRQFRSLTYFGVSIGLAALWVLGFHLTWEQALLAAILWDRALESAREDEK